MSSRHDLVTGYEGSRELVKPQVLFVDDEVAVLEALRSALRKATFAVLTATSATEALKLLKDRPIDVVVSDERMPGMLGSEFLGYVRQLHPNTIRIMLTGQASLDGAIRAINEGEIYRFLTKPCNPVQLVHTIDDALTIKSLARQSSRLLEKVKRQRSALEELEASNPGITSLEVGDDGCYVLEDENIDVTELLLAMERQFEQPLPSKGPRGGNR
jgi:DNA-binding NtrC family response regulator